MDTQLLIEPPTAKGEPGSERLRELLKDIPMNEELREVVIRIGDGATWDENTSYTDGRTMPVDACQAYGYAMMDIVNNRDVNNWGNDIISRKKITADTIQQYDYLRVPGTGATHAVFVLYVAPTTGALLTTESNCGGKTRTGWNIWSWDKVICVERRATLAWWE